MIKMVNSKDQSVVLSLKRINISFKKKNGMCYLPTLGTELGKVYSGRVEREGSGINLSTT